VNRRQPADASTGQGLTLVSFDIDGTLFFGDPPGPLELSFVHAVLAQGHVIGSASDRPRSHQERLWSTHEVAVSFIGGKHHLGEVRDRFPAERYVHIGDTDTDEHFALLAGFEFVWVDRVPDATSAAWLL